MPYRNPVSSNGAIGLGEMPWLRAVIGTKPQFSHVEMWSVNWRKSPMKNNVEGLDGAQSQDLAEAGGGDFGSNLPRPAIE